MRPYSAGAENPTLKKQSTLQSVYVVTSQLGFEALLHQCPIVCFGVPFYSGWGLTDDRTPCQRRQQQHSIEGLFAAACLKYTRYIDPETGSPCKLEALIELIALQRQYQTAQVDTLYALGFSLWKRAFIRQFVGGMARQLVFVRKPETLKKLLSRAPGTKGLLIWGPFH